MFLPVEGKSSTHIIVQNQKVIGTHKGCFICAATLLFKDLCCQCSFPISNYSASVAIATFSQDKLVLSASKKLQGSQSIEDKFCLTTAVMQKEDDGSLVSEVLALQSGWEKADHVFADLGNCDFTPFQGYSSPTNIVDAVVREEMPLASCKDVIVMIQRM